MLEEFLGGTHQVVSSGVTDVTTENAHIEIKEWTSWKMAVGQILCYNSDVPKPNLAIYFFGKYGNDSKKHVLSKLETFGIKAYEFEELEDGVGIKDLKTMDIIYTYKPS